MKYKANSEARNTTVQFLYQCEVEKVFYFSGSQFQLFSDHFQVSPEVKELAQELAIGIFNRIQEIDQILTKHASPRWALGRMAAMDRSVLRLATFELLVSTAPVKVILNEAIELAKLYGTEHSGKFVNGLLDSIAQSIGTKASVSEER